MKVQTQKRYYTPEEYLELEDKAEYKSEYRDGEIVPMTGGTTNHNKIALNLAAYLKFALRGKSYDIYIGDVRLWIPRYRQHTYSGSHLHEVQSLGFGGTGNREQGTSKRIKCTSPKREVL